MGKVFLLRNESFVKPIVAETTEGNAGLGWTNGEALSLYGWYTMLVYVASIPGGLIADKLLGQKKSVLYGGILLLFGHSILAIEAMWAFYTGLVLIVCGVGMLKPNISTMVGGLYKKGDIRRDKGFTIFYIGINVGAFLSSLIVGYVGEVYGWHYGFGLAGIGMFLGILQYVGLLLIGIAFAVGFAIVVYNDGNKIEKDRILVTYLAFLIVIVFWGAFEQAGGLMNLYASQKTDLALGDFMVPASWFQSLNQEYFQYLPSITYLLMKNLLMSLHHYSLQITFEIIHLLYKPHN